MFGRILVYRDAQDSRVTALYAMASLPTNGVMESSCSGGRHDLALGAEIDVSVVDNRTPP